MTLVYLSVTYVGLCCTCCIVILVSVILLFTFLIYKWRVLLTYVDGCHVNRMACEHYAIGILTDIHMCLHHLKLYCYYDHRCIDQDKFEPLSAKFKFSTSIGDFFSLLASMTDAFFTHLRSMSPYSLELTSSYITMINEAISSYGDAINQSCGQVGDLRPKLQFEKQQSWVSRTVAETATHMQAEKQSMKNMFSRLGRKKSVSAATAAATGSNDEKDDDREDSVTRPDTVPASSPVSGNSSGGDTATPRGGHARTESKLETKRSFNNGSNNSGDVMLAQQSLEKLCVRLCCLEAALEKITSLAQNFRSQWLEIVDDSKATTDSRFDKTVANKVSSSSPSSIISTYHLVM
jgi:hypothetical protein